MANTTARKDSMLRSQADQPSTIRRFIFSVNWLLLINAALLIALGLVVVYSATRGRPAYSFSRQIMGVGLGAAIMLLLWIIDYRKLENSAIFALILAMLLSLSPMIPGIGVEVLGGARWIKIFGQQIQPSEFAKIPAIFMMASLLSEYRGRLTSGKDYMKCLGFIVLPMGCVMLQPDLGTALVFLVIGFTVLFVGGANRWWLTVTIVIGALLVVGILTLDPILDQRFGRDVLLKDYQINRLLVFLNEDLDPTGIGFNLRQSKIAIGSGGWSGVGYMQGSQSGLGFLPEAPSDFIFCVLAEEFGFVGSMTLIGLYALLVLISLRVAIRADSFGSLLVAGCIGMWVFQIIENIGMTCGMMPITGIPLPFMSYGSSCMVVNLCAVGIIASVSMRTAWNAQAKPTMTQLIA
ncbi:MAG: rod shape-determining protein RodA [Coriobacteriia bacterium]|nr:rod shape-determining protein RodA [Coriobacteriia bacterium]